MFRSIRFKGLFTYVQPRTFAGSIHCRISFCMEPWSIRHLDAPGVTLHQSRRENLSQHWVFSVSTANATFSLTISWPGNLDSWHAINASITLPYARQTANRIPTGDRPTSQDTALPTRSHDFHLRNDGLCQQPGEELQCVASHNNA